MKTKAYLIDLAGGGDTTLFLLDEKDWAHLNACVEWNRFSGDPAPVPPDDLVDRAMDGSVGETREEIIGYLTPDPISGSHHNDVALNMPASLFNGEAFYDGGVKALMAFVYKHDLDLEEAYDGCIY